MKPDVTPIRDFEREFIVFAVVASDEDIESGRRYVPGGRRFKAALFVFSLSFSEISFIDKLTPDHFDVLGAVYVLEERHHG